MLDRWSAREIIELGFLMAMEHYEPLKIDIFAEDGSLKDADTLKREEFIAREIAKG